MGFTDIRYLMMNATLREGKEEVFSAKCPLLPSRRTKMTRSILLVYP